MSGEGVEPFRLGTRPRWGETKCGFGVDEPACSEAAVFHVMWLESAATSPTCEEHLAFIVANADQPFEVHVHGGDCGMPGALWHHPYEDEEVGYCFFPMPDDASAMVDAEEPLLVLTAPLPPPGRPADGTDPMEERP